MEKTKIYLKKILLLSILALAIGYSFYQIQSVFLWSGNKGKLTFTFKSMDTSTVTLNYKRYFLDENTFKVKGKIDTEGINEVVFDIDKLSHLRYANISFNTPLEKLTLVKVQLNFLDDVFIWNEETKLKKLFKFIYNQYKSEESVKVMNVKKEAFILNFKRSFMDVLDKQFHKQFVNTAWLFGIIGLILLLVFTPNVWIQKLPFQTTFLTGLFGLVIFIFVFGAETQETKEKRALEPNPSLSFKDWHRYPSRFNRYFNDHFPFRNELVTINAKLKVDYFNVSPVPTHVMLGENNYLYFSHREIIDLYAGTKLFKEAELEKIKQNLENRTKWCKERGAEYVLVIAPLKHTIYSEYLPPFLKKKNPINKMDQLYEYLNKNSTVKLIDLRPTLFESKETFGHNIYYKTDTHWNKLGAFKAYQKIMESIGHNDYHKASDYDIKIRPAQDTGDLLDLIGTGGSFTRKPVVLIPKWKKKADYVSKKDYINSSHFLRPPVYLENSNTELPRLVMFHDSFSTYLMSHLSEHFSSSSFFWCPEFLRPAVEKEKPDVIVHEVYERFLDKLLIEDLEE